MTARDKTSIAHITVDRQGKTHCERCGATYYATDAEARRFDMSGTTRWMLAHKACKPVVYVS
jgi:hypothetical protein